MFDYYLWLVPDIAFEERPEPSILQHENEKKCLTRLDMLRERLASATDKAQQSVFGFSTRSEGLKAIKARMSTISVKCNHKVVVHTSGAR